jgi:hypothetical protein
MIQAGHAEILNLQPENFEEIFVSYQAQKLGPSKHSLL